MPAYLWYHTLNIALSPTIWYYSLPFLQSKNRSINSLFNVTNKSFHIAIEFCANRITSFPIQVHISKEYLQLEPIGLVFVFFFALILVIQFTAMLFHRFGTLSHILASTELNFCKKKSEDLTQDQLIDKVYIYIYLHIFNLSPIFSLARCGNSQESATFARH